MDDQITTQQAPSEPVIVNDNLGAGTSENVGQSEQVNKPNDPALMQNKIEMTQAEFTREMQRIADQKRNAELELQLMNQKIEAQRQAMQYYQQPQQQVQAQPNPLIEQFGQEAGGALLNQLNQYQIKTELMLEELKIKEKVGAAEYEKYNYQYFNPMTGQMEVRNKIMDKRTMFNPITQQWNTIDDAINSVRNPQDLEAQIRQKIMAELQSKQNATPISQTSAPTTPAKGDGGLDDAIRQAFSQHGGL